MGARSRRKGASFERLIAKRLKEVFPDARRGFQFRTGRETSDITNPVFHIECKHQKRCNIKAALEQAARDSKGTGKIPVAITRDDRKPILVTMLLDDWLEMVKKLYGEAARG